MADSETPRGLDVSNYVGSDDPQQYVEVGSNIFLGTKDGIKYTLVQSSDSKFRLVEALSDSSSSFQKASYVSPLKNENSKEYQDDWSTSSSGPKVIKLMAVKSEQSPCKGQGDEIGNSVISPIASVSSFKESGNTVEKVSFQESLTDQDSISDLTYTTLLPKQENKGSLSNTYYSTTPRSQLNCSIPFPHPIEIRPQRFVRRGRTQLNMATSSFSPIPRIRRGAPRQRRPRRNAYQYTPQILHSTPNSLSSMNLSGDSQPFVSDSSSGSQNSSNFSHSQLSIEYPRAPNNTPSSTEVDPDVYSKTYSIQWIPHATTGVEDYISVDPRETHNEKERKRRLRIKNACQCMRILLPGLTDKMDNATVFEQAVRYISFIRETVGNQYDHEFIDTNYIY